MQNKITVIIPCYNGYRFMNPCLTSLESQTYKNFKVVVVDDCSTDDSYQSLLEYKSKTPLEMTVVRNEQNMKLALTRRVGVKYADTQWICFCDCDDWYENDFLEKMLAKAESQKADMVMCHFNYAYSDGSKKFLPGLNILSDTSSKEEFLAYTPMSLCRFLFKKNLYEDLIVPQIQNAEDGAVTPQMLAKSHKIAIVHEGLYNYFIREDSLSNTPKPTVYYDFLKAQQVIDVAIGKDYPQECEFLAIKNFCYGAILNGLKAKIPIGVLRKDYNEFSKKHPKWYENKYIHSMSKSKKVFLWFLRYKMFLALKMMASLHSKLSV